MNPNTAATSASTVIDPLVGSRHRIDVEEFTATQDGGATMEPEPEIVRLVHEWFGAASRGDASAINRFVSANPATRLIGSDPDEWLQGGEQIGAFLRSEVEGAAGAVSFAPRDTEAFTSGDVGWAATRLTITLPDGRRVNPRWTAVLVREDSGWKFVQTHASIAVANEQVGWSYD